jgi:thioredoxin-related protein
MIMGSIRWRDDVATALQEARATNRNVLLEFMSPTCGGCRAMGAITFVDDDVADAVEEHCVPVQVDASDEANRELVQRYHVPWTPDIRILDDDGDDLSRINGFLPPHEFLPQLLASVAEASLRSNDMDGAAEHYAQVLEQAPHSAVAAEARYYLAVARYKGTGDRSHLQDNWLQLQADHPDSVWRMKQSFIEGRR